MEKLNLKKAVAPKDLNMSSLEEKKPETMRNKDRKMEDF
jgi:hypothetical protein